METDGQQNTHRLLTQGQATITHGVYPNVKQQQGHNGLAGQQQRGHRAPQASGPTGQQKGHRAPQASGPAGQQQGHQAPNHSGATGPVCIDDYEEYARQVLPKAFFAFFANGADDEVTLRDNKAAFKRLRLRPRLMRDVSKRDLSTTILGHRIAFPVCIAPTALHCMAHRDGEMGTAKAAALLKTGMTLSSWATSSLEDVAEASPKGLRWFQINIFKDRNIVRNFVERAEHLGYKALVVTLDKPETAKKRDTHRCKFTVPQFVRLRNFEVAGFDIRSEADVDGLKDSSVTWAALDWLRSITTLPIVAKGILTDTDAREAVMHGVSGIIVSNHGGRQLDGVSATIDALPEVVEAVKGTGVEVYMDGGVRTGTDVLKAIALGARAVFVGRPILWGLACNGKDGVKRVLETFRDEFSLAMALAGCRSVDEITQDLVYRRDNMMFTTVIPSKL